jgi:phage recombination protein Bet
MNSVTTLNRPSSALVTAEHAEAVRTALKSSLYPGAADASVDLVLAYCKASDLDPMTKPVHIVPMKVSTGRKDNNGYDIKEMRDVIMPGIGLYRVNAARTGLYAGCSEPEFGPTRELQFKREKWEDGPNNRRVKKLVDATISYPEWCRITVRKLLGNTVVEFTAVEYWLENYASKGDDGSPNAMWEKRAFGQLAKCTEAQALRKAFPEAVGSQPTAEEMEGKIIDVESSVVQPERVAMPQAKAVTHTPGAAQSEPAQEGTGGGESPAAGEPAKGIHDLTPGQLKLLRAKAKNAGLFEDADLLEKFPSVGPENINDVLEQLREIAEAQDAG